MNDKEIKTVANLLKKFNPGFLPYPIFEQIARLVALPIIEFIPLRLHNNGTEVLLIKRDETDKKWPNMLHTPGTVIRATDVSDGKTENWQAFERILNEELQRTQVSDPHYVGSLLHESKRGAEQAQLYWVEVLAKPQVGNFYNINELPPNLIDSQIAFIHAAANNFKNYKLKSG